MASKLPIKKQVFDLVIINFVFHWVDRTSLFKSLEEIDRVVADNGYLVIGDFFPDKPTKVYYHHLPKLNLYTYKQDYSKIFLDSGIYEVVDEIIFSHDKQKAKSFVMDDRAKCTLLKKRFNELYKIRKLNNA